MAFQNIIDGLGKFVDMEHGYRLKEIEESVICKDGTTLSAQASKYHYCTPRNDLGPYTHIEIGFPSVRPPIEWEQYFDGEWQQPGFMGSIRRMYNNRGSIWFALQQGIKEKRWSYFRFLFTLKDNATNSVYGYVPVELVEGFIDLHGGELTKNG